jgi:REP element-mobilizing transposase RayT
MLKRSRKGYIYLEAFRIADDSGVKIYGCVNVGNHIHVVLQAKNRRSFQRFLRVFAGWVAMLVTGARKGSPLRERFWTLPVYTDIVEWGNHFQNVIRYLRKNLAESDGKSTKIFYPNFQIFENSG